MDGEGRGTDDVGVGLDRGERGVAFFADSAGGVGEDGESAAGGC